MNTNLTKREIDEQFDGLLAGRRHLDTAAGNLLLEAYELASRAHEGQYRLSGDPFISHGVEVAGILVKMGLDADAIAAGILHDVVEDTGIGLDEIENRFGKEIARLVMGLTKLGKLNFRSQEERQVESARRMLVSMAEDIRVIFIKLADRLHNMRTLEYLPPEKRLIIARETLEIYAPLAHRLGVGGIKDELEDLSFRFLESEQYDRVKEVLSGRAADGEALFEQFRAPIEAALKENGIEATITSRIKHLYSIWKKMERKSVQIEGIYDLYSMRIITKHVRDCYCCLEIIHGLFRPIHHRFKDYIAAPKSNMYQTLHTTVMDDWGRRIEIQIRTEQMNYAAEYGIAAHWVYKEKGKASVRWDRWMDWFRQTLDYQLELTDPAEFLRYLKTDLFQNEIYVFTPAGELKQLPMGSMPIDFAYSVHSDIGNHCSAARVNGKLVSLDYKLASGDRVEIITSSKASPHEKWLKLVRTSRARSKIRQWFRSKSGEQKESTVRSIVPERDEAADEAGVELDRLREIVRSPIKGIRLEGIDNLLVRFAKCCQPVPGDPVIGIVTRGRGVSVHRADCNNVRRMEDPGRLFEVEWETIHGQKYLVSLLVMARDRTGLVSEISRRITCIDAEVRSGHFNIKEGEIKLFLMVGISDLKHLKRAISEIEGIDSVLSVHRAV